MDKISGILPPSSRTSSGDVSTSQPARPGAPGMGRVAGRGSNSMEVEDRVSFFPESRMRDNLAGVYKNNPETARTKAVDEIAKRFFETPSPTGRETAESEEVAAEMQEAPVQTIRR